MPTNRKRVSRNRKSQDQVHPAIVFMFVHGRKPTQEEIPHNFSKFLWNHRAKLVELWLHCKDEIMRRWLKEKPPFTRPPGFWWFDPSSRGRPHYETEKEFLTRHRELLTAEELKILDQKN